MTQKSSASVLLIARLWSRPEGEREASHFRTVAKRNAAAVGSVLRWAGGWKKNKKKNIFWQNIEEFKMKRDNRNHATASGRKERWRE